LPRIPDGAIRINPAWRDLDKQVTSLTTRLRRHQANLGGFALLLADLTEANFHHPETGHRFIYQRV